MTKRALTEALAQPRDIAEPLVHAYMARRYCGCCTPSVMVLLLLLLLLLRIHPALRRQLCYCHWPLLPTSIAACPRPASP